MLHLFHGDPYLRRKELDRLLQEKLPDPSLRDLNFTRTEGSCLEWAALEEECRSLPMLGESRVILVDSLAPRWQKEGDAWRKRGVACFSRLPESTELVILEDTLSGAHPLHRAVVNLISEGKAEEKLLQTPGIRDGSLVRWIVDRVRAQGGDISGGAAAMLAAFVGSSLQRLDQEIEKLVTYADGERITKEHIALLVRDTQAARIFDLTDAVSAGRRGSAVRLYRQLLAEGETPLRVLNMIARQYRILISVKSLSEKGMREKEIASDLGIARYPVKKALGEVHRFTYERLITAYDLILETDIAIKTGGMDHEVAVELLIASL